MELNQSFLAVVLYSILVRFYHGCQTIREEIRQIEAISMAQKTEQHFKRLNDLEAEIRRRHPELQPAVPSGKFYYDAICVEIITMCCVLLQNIPLVRYCPRIVRN